MMIEPTKMEIDAEKSKFWGPSVDAGMNGMAWSENQSLPSYPISTLTSVGSYSWAFGGPKVIQI